nr:putative ribonuclease H-like domain-containing protein [Tanacetum cinerariifolium]
RGVTISTNVPTASANIRVASISQDTACTYVASQSSGSQIKFENINQIDEDDMEEIDIKWNMALLSMRADKAPRSQDRGRRDNYRQGSKVEEQAPKALMAINRVGWDWSYMANDEENHALVTDEEAPTEFVLMANISAESKVFDNSLCSKDCKKNTDSLNSKITDLTDKLFDAKNMIYHYKLGLAQVESKLVEHKDREIKYCEKIRGLEFKTESTDDYIEILKKELETLKKEKERLDKNKEGLGYSVVPPPPAQIYSSPKKDMSWTSLPKFKDDTVTNYSRPAPTIESYPDDTQNRNPSVTENEASISTISPKSFIKFVTANDSPTKSKIEKAEKAKKSFVKYVEQYRKPTQKPNVKGNQRNWNNLKSHQLGPNFKMKKNVCFNCGDFNHLTYDCRKRVKQGTSRSQNNTHKSFTPRPAVHKPYRPPMRPIRSNMNGARPNITSFNKPAHLYTNRLFQRTSAVRSQYRVPWVPTVNRNFPPVNRKFSNVSRTFSTVNRKFLTANRKFPTGGIKFHTANIGKKGKAVKPSACYWDSVCSRHMTCNISYLSDFEPFEGGYMSFVQGGCKITRKGTIKTSINDEASQEVKKDVFSLRYIALPNWVHDALLESSSIPTACFTDSLEPLSDTRIISKRVANQVETPSLDNILTLTNRFEDILGVTTNSVDSDGEEADVSNIETTITASPSSTLRIHKDHPKSQIIGPVDTLIQTKNKSKKTLVDCPKGVRPIGIKWVLKNKKDERGIAIRNKARLVAQGHTQEEGIDYDEVFSHVARIKVIILFLAYASFMGFTVYQMDVKSVFLYGTIDKEVYVIQPPGFQDPDFPAKVYKVEKAMYELHQAPRAWYGTLSTYLLTKGFQKVLQKEDGIFLSQDKYVGDILKKFGYSDVISSNTLMEKGNP